MKGGGGGGGIPEYPEKTPGDKLQNSLSYQSLNFVCTLCINSEVSVVHGEDRC